MKRPENDKWLDEALSKTIGSKKSSTDFKAWKQKHPEAVEMLTSRTSREVREEIERRQKMFVRKRAWHIAAVLAVVLGLGAISVVGVNIGRYYYKGKNDSGHHIFYSKGGEGRLDDAFVTLGADEVTDIEQTRKDLEEIELLRQQDKRELLKVKEIMTDGILEMKVHVYKYELSDGRTIDMPEGIEGKYALCRSPQWEELLQLQKAGRGEGLGTYEETVEGRVFSFKREKYFLSDGTEIIWSVGTPKKDQ